MNRPLLIAGALFLACPWLNADLQDGDGEDFWEELDPTAEVGEWKTYETRDRQLEVEVWELLRSVTSGAAQRGLVVRELTDHGPSITPLLFAILTGESLEFEGDELPNGEPGELEAPRRDVGGISAEQLVYEVLTALPPNAVAEHMRLAASGDAPTEIRVLAARVLALTGGPEALDVMLEVLASMDPLQLQRPFLRSPFGTALEEILRRNPAELRDLGERLHALHLEVTLLVVESLPAELVGAGAPVVLGLFGRDARLDLALMEQLAEFASSPLGAGDTWSSLDCQRTARFYLSANDWHMRSRAVVAISRLNDVEALETLVQMLGDEHRSVQRTVHWSLREMTGQTLAPDRERWAAWVAEERAWFAGPRTEIEWRILSNEDAEIVAGLRELNQHPLFRDSSADLLGPLLLDASPAVFGAAVGLLTRLESPRAVPFLVACLGVPEEYKSASAWIALKSLTDLDLPQERAAWQDGLGI